MDKRQLLNPEDVVSVTDSDKICINHKTFTVQELLGAFLTKWFNSDIGKRWLFEGTECQYLAPGKLWKKGKIKISLEFIPDEAESPLDEIRREMTENQS
ncbi:MULTISPECIES: KGK domain-containing protein [unclassified Synechocystis]|uniref:KGK domain-containing protein n=1 Tax=unclassified Synechocystis TaxID=2640012 RepID=UPI0002A5952B|nr:MULTISPECIES: KGK domain-containing protein [unclassified Synechocystis]BAM51572.1 hypothetical protein BEST7613_2641 [Synechocystis sp. PCC 6803] [Bacillus subtilis BEST7613]ALJ67508.1 hypothetical protein AOY38_06435 [Synechocystis sp. PCC 6803]AVP89354.1 KGK family protein [Synechocystis sp. IPPAS B-1465]MBD2618565.1 KGK family protein [Synechocystis sp. FACHB-898]MBD2637841.1 KGK family protein [Synechocystis sp. FACHB-908]